VIGLAFVIPREVEPALFGLALLRHGRAHAALMGLASEKLDALRIIHCTTQCRAG
jgi:hypothetical protein